MFEPNTSSNLIGYCDSDWGGCSTSRKSTEGFVLLNDCTAVSWKSKKQTIVALSTCEAEYIAISSITKEAMWLSRLRSEILRDDLRNAVQLYIDNDGAVVLAKKHATSQRTKHIDIKYHFIRQAIENNDVSLHRVGTKDQVADPLCWE